MRQDSPAHAALLGWMRQALIDPEQVSAAEVERLLQASPRLDPAAQLAIYQRSYHRRLLACLREQFPALCHALGRDLFTDFAREYLQARPPESYTLYDLGRRFPGYLEETRPDRAAPPEEREVWFDFMVDLARFERSLFVMFDAPGHEGRPLADLDTPDDRLRLQPCVALGDHRFPVAWYYHEVRKDGTPALPPRQRSPVALVRKDHLTRTLALTVPQHAFLQAMQGGSSVAAAFAAVAEALDIAEAEMRRAWAAPDGSRRRWIDAGLFVAA